MPIPSDPNEVLPLARGLHQRGLCALVRAHPDSVITTDLALAMFGRKKPAGYARTMGRAMIHLRAKLAGSGWKLRRKRLKNGRDTAYVLEFWG